MGLYLGVAYIEVGRPFMGATLTDSIFSHGRYPTAEGAAVGRGGFSW
ncbi:MAG: hypothetical protein OT477_14770 [Chloroflexi bacterium]|nr:hypothetical protein [Chloroflexota bacterium]